MTDPAPAFDPESFRQAGHAFIDWIANYWSTVEKFPVRSQVAPGWVRSQLPASAPEQGEPMKAVLADVDRVITPALTHWQHPSFFAYFPASASAPAILGDLLSAGLGVQGMLWATSPACTELETLVLDWLVDLLGLPAQYRSESHGGFGGGVIQDTASSSVLCALIAAREQATGGTTNNDGLRTYAKQLTAYTSGDAHSSVEKAFRIAGLGDTALRRVAVDTNGCMNIAELEAALQRDIAAGCQPFFVCATVGSTACGAIDDVPAIAKMARAHKMWLHVDSAWAGAAATCPELRPAIVAGAEGADSWCFNPHKWMMINFDCNCLFLRDRRPLIQALSVLPEYLRNKATESGSVIDYRDWQIPLGRRFRALKVWMTLRHFGAAAIREHIRQHVKWAEEFEGLVKADARFELVGKRSLSLVCFRLKGGDEENERLLEQLNATGKAYLSHAKINGKFAMRMAIGGSMTTREHVLCAWKAIAHLAK
ncbi:MAG: aminotransferase class V-fold PLP-dependent enzyme [Planctomycetes bacterium]|nr:aminotransferase class V-fold PLP-dependent enzyme [Planctomycetota bacterium]